MGCDPVDGWTLSLTEAQTAKYTEGHFSQKVSPFLFSHDLLLRS